MSTPLPAICFAEDVCRALRISRSTLKRLRRYGAFPIPEIVPRLDYRARWSGTAVTAYIEQTELNHTSGRVKPRLVHRNSKSFARKGIER